MVEEAVRKPSRSRRVKGLEEARVSWLVAAECSREGISLNSEQLSNCY